MHYPNQIGLYSDEEATERAKRVLKEYARKRVVKGVAITAAAVVVALAILCGIMLHRAVQDARNDFVVVFYVPQEKQPDALVRQGNLLHLPVAGAETVKVSLEDVIAYPERYGAWKDTDGDGKPKPSRKEVIEQVWHLPGGDFKDMNGNGRIGYYDKAHQPLGLHIWEKE